jgi:tetratricopeptide (TPR) repeat protein
MENKVTYRQQYTRCGKQRCRKCREGAGHGPYWYAYWSEKGRTVSKYIGTHLPEHVATSSNDKNGLAIPSLEQPRANISTYSRGTPILRIYLLGQFRIEHYTHNVWQIADSRVWHRRRARALLGCLLSSPGRRLGREQVMEMLWPDLDIDLAANRLNGAVHELRQILEPDISRPSSSRLLRLERDILELADNTLIWVDAEAFEQLLKDAEMSTDTQQAEQLLEEASMLYQGNYLLEELYSEWATPRRDALQRAWVGLQLRLTQIKVEQGAYVSAIELLDRLRNADPTNETALQRLMVLLTHLDRRGEALQVYRQYITTLQRDYEGEPLPETTELYETLRKGHIPPLFFTKPSPIPSNNVPLEIELAPTSTQTLAATQAVEQEGKDSPLSYTRPVFQLGRQNQTPLIGRDQEQHMMRQLLLTIEQQAEQETDSTLDTSLTAPSPLSTTNSSRPRHTHFLLLRGEAGIGKTRLAEELSLEAYNRGWTVAWSRSYEQEGGIPYHPWTELLRTLLHSDSTFSELVSTSASAGTKQDFVGSALAPALPLQRLSALLPELAGHVLSARPAPGVSHEQERLHLWEAALGLLVTLSKFHPLLLVFDDLHWADDSSIELLTYLTHHLKGQRVLLIGTCRDGELAPQHKLRALTAELQREQAIAMISVYPLTQSQIGSLVSHLPEHIISSIQAQSSGNPFFAEELARFVSMTFGETVESGVNSALSLQASTLAAFFPTETTNVETGLISVPTHQKRKISGVGHVLSQGKEQAPLDKDKPTSLLPDAIAALLERRLHRLSDGCRTLLGKAAVLGGSFELEQLLPMAPEHDEDAILDFLEEALHAGLLTEEAIGTHVIYHFWHPLIISHLYSRISAARRAQLHRKAADAIRAVRSFQSEKIAAAIVYHLSKGGGEPANIAYYAEQAGDQAYTLASYSEAQQYYLQAIRALIDQEIVGVASSAYHEYIRRIITQPVQQLSEKDVLQHYRLVERVAECSLVQGKFEDARHLYEYLLTLRNRDAFQQQIYGAQPVEAQQQREAQIRALLWREIGNTWTSTGGYDQALACYTQGKDVMSQAGVTSGAAWACLNIQVGALLRLEGNYYKARSYLQDALDMLEKAVQPDKQIASISTTDRKKIEDNATLTPLPNKLQDGESWKNLAESPTKTPLTRTERALSGDPLEIGYAHERLGIVAASLGQFNDALEHIHTALTIYSQSELITEMARTCGNMGAVYIIKGEHEAAQKFLRRSLELSERAGHLPNITFVMLNLGDVAQRSGNLREAEDWLQQSFALSEQINDREHMSWCNVVLAAVQADLGQLKEAAISLQRAISLGREIKNTRCIGYALIGLADLHILQAVTCTEVSSAPTNNQTAQRFLQRAKSVLQRAFRLEGMEVDNTIDGKYLLALVYFLLSDIATAREIAQQTLHEAELYESPRLIGRTHHLLARILASQDEMSEAISHFEQALALFDQRGLHLDYARTLLSYGTILLQDRDSLNMNNTSAIRNDTHKGQDLLDKARSIFASCQAAIDIAQVDQTLAHYVR